MKYKMDKIRRKLFGYFFSVAVFIVVTVFLSFSGVLQYYMEQHQVKELREKTEGIQERVEDFLCKDVETGRGAYLKYLDDMTLSKVYIIQKNGEPFTCGKNGDSEKIISESINKMAELIFQTEEYEQSDILKRGDEKVIYAGIPLETEEGITAALVLVDTIEMDTTTFRLPLMVLSICLVMSLLLAGFLCYYLSKKFMLPIQKIGTVIKEMVNGNYQAKTEVYDDNEIGVLARETDILAEKLEVARNESERMLQAQKDYVSNISHELRTPVTVLRSSIEALYDGIVPEEDIKDYQQQMLSETIALQRLVNDMLELSRLQNEDFPIEKENVELLSILEDAVRCGTLISRERKIQIHFEKRKEEWMFLGDYGRLRQMFLTVIENAVKYSETGKNIWVQTSEKGDHYYISIQDEGIGIPEEQQKLVFQKFYRASYGGEQGTGLGLVIMKNIADRHDVEVRLSSVYGKGTKVTFIFQKNKEMDEMSQK